MVPATVALVVEVEVAAVTEEGAVAIRVVVVELARAVVLEAVVAGPTGSCLLLTLLWPTLDLVT